MSFDQNVDILTYRWWSGNTQVLMGSSGLMETCWPVVKCSVCFRPRAVSQKAIWPSDLPVTSSPWVFSDGTPQSKGTPPPP